jgi:hypothetical protein
MDAIADVFVRVMALLALGSIAAAVVAHAGYASGAADLAGEVAYFALVAAVVASWIPLRGGRKA